MSELKLARTQKMPMTGITPYWRNPRRITEEAIRAVEKSIENYGYQQPIVVDRDGVIVVGHTRYEALKRLGWTEVEVFVSDLDEEAAQQYRIVDNRTSEYSVWDHRALVLELREFEESLLDQYFPFIDLEIETVTGASSPTQEEIQWVSRDIEKVPEVPESRVHTTGVECPACMNVFQVRTKSLPGMSEAEVRELLDGASERSAG